MARFSLTSTTAQNFVASVMVALGPGIYGAITILGAGGGPANAVQMANIVNSTLYAVLFVAGLFSGSVVTTLGPRYTFMIGSIGYPVFVGGLWYFTNSGKLGYPIFGGAILGLTAALLWTSASFVAFAYPEENQKGLFVAMQWGLFSVGSTLASLVAFGINYHAQVQQGPTAVYIVFILLMASGTGVAFFFIVDPKSVQKPDGTPIRHYPHQGFWIELKNQSELLKDWRMLVLFVPYFACEVPLIIASTLNGLYFNIRTRSLNSVMLTLMGALGSVFITFLLDNERIGGRRTRGVVSIAIMGTIITAGWIGLVVWLYRHPLDPLSPPLWDWTDGQFAGFFVLDLILGINMATYRSVAQWITSSLTNDPERLARHAGFFQGCLAGGLACAFGVEAAGLTQLHVVAFMFSMQAIGLVSMVVVTCFCVKATSVGELGQVEGSPKPSGGMPEMSQREVAGNGDVKV